MRTLICLITALALVVAPTTAIAGSPYPPTYHQPTYDTTVVEKVKVIGVPVNAPYIYSIGRDVQEDNEDRLVEKFMRRFKKEFDTAPPDAEPQAPISREAFKLVGGHKASGSSLDGKVLALFNSNCVQCHKPGQTKPGVQLFTNDRRLYFAPDQQKEFKRRQRIVDACDPDAGGEMPKNRPPLTKRERDMLKDWKDAASPVHPAK